MGWLKRVGARLKAMTEMRFPQAASWMFGWTEVGEGEYARKVGDGLDSNILVAPLLWIANTFPEARLSVRKEKGEETVIDRNHELAKLVRRPNPFYSGDDLWFAVILSFLTDGNAYVFRVRAAGKTKELWYLPHSMVEPIGDGKTFISHYEYRPDSAPIRLAPEDIIHFRFGLDPRNPRKGFSRLKPMLRAIFSDDEAERMVASLLKNRGIPGLVISPEKDVVLDPKDETPLKEAVKEKTTGANRGDPLILSAAVKVQQYGFSPSEMDLGDIRNTPEERICAMLGLPAEVVGFGTGKEATHVGATMREVIKLAWTGCLRPLGRRFAAALSSQILPEFDKDASAEVFFDDSEVEALQADMLVTAQIAEIEMRAGIATRAEARKRLGHEVTPADDVFYVPFNALETPRNEPSEPPAADPADPALPAPEAPKGAKRLSRMQARILRARDSAFKRFEPLMRKRMLSFFADLGDEVEAAWVEMDKGLEDELRVDRLFSRLDAPKHSAELRRIFASHYVDVHNDNIGTLAGLGVSVNLPDSVQLEVLSQGGTRAGLVDLSKSARARALRVVEDAREEGLGVPETARLLRDAVPAGPFKSPKTRAEIIARTETHYAQTSSSLRAYRAMEGITRVQIIDARLGNTDEDCEAANGQIVSFAEAQRMLEQEHPNGTRDVVPVFEEA